MKDWQRGLGDVLCLHFLFLLQQTRLGSLPHSPKSLHCPSCVLLASGHRRGKEGWGIVIAKMLLIGHSDTPLQPAQTSPEPLQP